LIPFLIQLTNYRKIDSLVRMATLLITNDDGIEAKGIQVLGEALIDLGDVWTIAPHIERSACSRAVSLNRPLRVFERGEKRLAVDGTPVDCVLLAFRCLLDPKPDLVISGINLGHNLGEDLDYSGTVAAAAEGALQGAAKASVAISVKSDSDSNTLLKSAEFVRSLAITLLEQPLPKYTYLNVNMPAHKPRGVRWTRQGEPLGPGEVEIRSDPRGKRYYWIGNRPKAVQPMPDTDFGALNEHYISANLLSLERSYCGDWKRPAFEM
jgi:5'-nucleotidase